MISVSAIILENNRVEIRERSGDQSIPDIVITIPILFAQTVINQLDQLLSDQGFQGS